jgi:hypothetical protein
MGARYRFPIKLYHRRTRMLSRRMQCAGLFAAAIVSLGCAMASDEDKPLVFEQGSRRDPFTFSVMPAYIPPPPPPVSREPEFDIHGAREKLTQLYNRAELMFLESQGVATVRVCDEGLLLIQGIPVETRNSFGVEQERILRLRTAANRMISRAEAEGQFKALNLSLTGVVIRDGQSKAIVNSKVVARGELIPLPEATQDTVVLDIQDDAVVFLYRGYRMMRTIKADSGR